eukprot:2850667-Rhodomonas_salina.1
MQITMPTLTKLAPLPPSPPPKLRPDFNLNTNSAKSMPSNYRSSSVCTSQADAYPLISLCTPQSLALSYPTSHTPLACRRRVFGCVVA